MARRTRYLLIVCGLLAACGGAPEEETLYPITSDEATEDGGRIEYTDTDRDGTPEVAKFFEPVEGEFNEDGTPKLHLARTEIDLTGDGAPNLIRVYDTREDLVREEMDSDLEGHVDHWVFWEDGTIMRTERDEDNNGIVDVFRFYREGFLVRVQRDRDGDGEIDMWAFYDRQGLARVGYDVNNDGAADNWTRRPGSR